jgi:hypothetical protein
MTDWLSENVMLSNHWMITDIERYDVFVSDKLDGFHRDRSAITIGIAAKTTGWIV